MGRQAVGIGLAAASSARSASTSASHSITASRESSAAIPQDRHVVGRRRPGMAHPLEPLLGGHHGLCSHGSTVPASP